MNLEEHKGKNKNIQKADNYDQIETFKKLNGLRKSLKKSILGF